MTNSRGGRTPEWPEAGAPTGGGGLPRWGAYLLVLGALVGLTCGGMVTYAILHVGQVQDALAAVAPEVVMPRSEWTTERGRFPVPRSDQPPYRIDGTVEMLASDRIFTHSRYTADGYPLSVPDPLEIVTLVDGHKFEALDAYLSRLQHAAEGDVHNETWIYYALDVFDNAEDARVTAVEMWATRMPESALAHTARGMVHKRLGFQARGTKWSRLVTDEQWAGMHAEFEVAAEAFARAEELDPNIVKIYTERMPIADAGHQLGRPASHFKAGLARRPRSLTLRWAYIHSLWPRWGGSYREMWEVADAAQQYVDENPRLRTLYGWAAYYQWVDRQEDAPEDLGVRLGDVALSYGDDPYFYWMRAGGYMDEKRWAEALVEANRALSLRPQAVSWQARRAKLLAWTGDFEAAKADIGLLMKRWPDNTRVARARRDILTKERQAGRALTR